MAGIPLTELIVSVVSDNRQALNAAKEVEAAYENTSNHHWAIPNPRLEVQRATRHA